ncbi:hypothetical protein B296_00013222 [Ensete ventricosum]|uniref:Uncharacterized protein n=1 Tax=Ensete ventricosum TaxID=4639 RepID=A0A426ZVJ9_ENSVE|nr:hypothetical protein B296_00013222 [Ensete ventricosum]
MSAFGVNVVEKGGVDVGRGGQFGEGSVGDGGGEERGALEGFEEEEEEEAAAMGRGAKGEGGGDGRCSGGHLVLWCRAKKKKKKKKKKKRETSLIYKERHHHHHQHQVYEFFLWEVVLGPAFEANLAEGEAKEQPQVPCDQPQPEASSQTTRSEEEDERTRNLTLSASGRNQFLPERRCESWACRPVSQLRADALEEEPRQALPTDRRNARRREPPDQTEPDHVEVRAQPIPLEAAPTAMQKDKPRVNTHLPSSKVGMDSVILTR